VPARALLLDFGGVLTTSVFDSFGDFAAASGLPRDAFGSLLREDQEAARLLVEAEVDRLSEAEFGAAIAARLGERHGVAVAGEGLVDRLHGTLRPDERMIALTRAVRAAGIPTAMVSNSLGYGPYAILDLDSLFDAQLYSGRVGVRKPSRRIYAMAADALGVEPGECVMVDDLEQNLAGAARIGVAGVLHTDAAETAAALEGHFGIPLTEAIG
jgi:putative hydrolase of the HAD superfamily